jgi:nucleoside-triphosphatase THEP1
MIVILSGPVHSGKTTLLEKVAVRLRSAGRDVRGYLTPARRAAAGSVEGYDLQSLQDGTRTRFLARDARSAAERAGPFVMDEEGLRRAEEIILSAPDSALLVVDEVGPLELEGGGVRRALERALASRTGTTLIVVREAILDEFLESFDVGSARVIGLPDPGAESSLVDWLGSS